MNKISKLFEKIRIFLKNIFGGKSTLLLTENIKSQEDNLSEVNDSDKEGFFEIYENLKKGIISLDDLMITDLIKVLAISKESLNIKDNEINELKNELLNIEQEYDLLKTENQRLNNM